MAASKSIDPKKKRLRQQLIVIGILLVVLVICHFISGGRLLQPQNLKNIITQALYPMMTALGMMFIFTSGMIDLSIGAQIILAANVGAVCVENYGLGYPGLILGTIITIIICEMFSASCSVFVGIPSWIAGLGCALIFEALGNIFISSALKGTAVIYLKHCNVLGQFPVNIIVAALVFAFAYFMFNKTKLGFNLRAIGTGGEVAEAMGINRKKTIMLSALVGAIIIGIAAIVQVSYSSRFTPCSGMGSLSGIFKALAVILIAGSFSRFFNDAVGCLLGGIIVGALFNILTLMHVPSGTSQDVILALVVIICGVFSALGNKGVVK